MSGIGQSGLVPASVDMKSGVLNSVANSSAPSIGASSLITDANSAFSCGPQLQRSTSINTDSYMHLPTSPLSFSSNNISGSSVMDGSSILQQSSRQERHVPNNGASSVTSHPTVQEPGVALHGQKKPRIEMRQEDILQQQMIQQLLQRQDSLQMPGRQNPQLETIMQQQRLALQQQKQQHQMLQSIPQMERAQLVQQQQLRQQLMPYNMQPGAPVKRAFDSGICARRLMQYLYHQRHRPPDNSITYWRKFVSEYFAPQARKRWCLSSYSNIANHTLGVLPQTSMGAWHCDICGSRSGKGFEATFEILPRLCQIKFDHGVIDEHLFLGMPRECRSTSGVMMLEYAKAVQESVYEHLRVVREGQLRIIFTPELKIISWEFCAQRHEEFLPRRLIAPQVNQLLQVAQKYQVAANESGSAGVSQQDLQASCNMFVTAGRQLAKNLESQLLNDFGFSKRYVRCLQISEVVNSMKDLIDICRKQKIGPIESLRNYSEQAAAKLQTQKIQEKEQLISANCIPTDQSNLSKILGNPGLSCHMNNNSRSTRFLNNAPSNVVGLSNYQNLLKNSMSPSHSTLQQEVSSVFNSSNQAQVMQFQTSVSSVLSNGLSGPVQQQPPPNSNLLQQNNLQPSAVNQQMQQHVIQQLLQEVMNNDKGTSEPSPSAPNLNCDLAGGNLYGSCVSVTGSMPARMNNGPVRNTTVLGNVPSNMSNNPTGMVPSRNNSFKSVASNPTVGGSSISSEANLHQHMDLPELEQIAQEFSENGIFSDFAGKIDGSSAIARVGSAVEL
ncbi:probable transcriptional regulator SLK2 [Typha angustifolia]|uniref:probable transcriptional regulator SLK2 n=1 Tax=Typha angustifolia TaxID=59011 RepID=UPI003C2C54D0